MLTRDFKLVKKLWTASSVGNLLVYIRKNLHSLNLLFFKSISLMYCSPLHTLMLTTLVLIHATLLL